MRMLTVGLALLLVGCPAADDDPRVCHDDDWTAGTCAVGEAVFEENTARNHVTVPPEYDTDPPSSGNHLGQWATWGEYDYLPPERWIHNLEHGGAVLLYHPCADASVVDALREYARARADDDGGAFRWILTPYPDLPTAVAVVAWEWTYSAECVDEAEIEGFVVEHYRQAPEDVAGDGSFSEGWIGL